MSDSQVERDFCRNCEFFSRSNHSVPDCISEVQNSWLEIGNDNQRHQCGREISIIDEVESVCGIEKAGNLSLVFIPEKNQLNRSETIFQEQVSGARTVIDDGLQHICWIDNISIVDCDIHVGLNLDDLAAWWVSRITDIDGVSYSNKT